MRSAGRRVVCLRRGGYNIITSLPLPAQLQWSTSDGRQRESIAPGRLASGAMPAHNLESETKPSDAGSTPACAAGGARLRFNSRENAR